MASVHFLLNQALLLLLIQFALIVAPVDHFMNEDAFTSDRIQIELEGMLCMQLTEHGM